MTRLGDEVWEGGLGVRLLARCTPPVIMTPVNFVGASEGAEMAAGQFDPYHRWLGISPKDQPPNHYRLLAVDLFEEDPEVIRDAAEQRMAHVRTYGLGKYSEVSQGILNELAAAKVCLFDPERKAAYDKKLREKLKASKASPPTLSKQPETPEAGAEPGAGAAPAPDRAKPAAKAEIPKAVALPVVERPRNDQARQKMLLIYGGAGAACVLLVVIAALAMSGRGGGEPPRTSGELPRGVRGGGEPSRTSGELPRGVWVDVLKQVDIGRDRVHGEWKRTDDGITMPGTPSPQMAPRMMLPVRIEGSYELRVDFTRHIGQGVVNILIPVGLRRCMVVLSGWNGKAGGIEQIDGRRLIEGNPTSTRPSVLINGQRYTLVTRVRTMNDESVAIEASLNGKPYTAWTGRESSLSLAPHWQLPKQRRAGLGGQCFAAFHSVQLRLISGTASWATSSN